MYKLLFDNISRVTPCWSYIVPSTSIYALDSWPWNEPLSLKYTNISIYIYICILVHTVYICHICDVCALVGDQTLFHPFRGTFGAVPFLAHRVRTAITCALRGTDGTLCDWSIPFHFRRVPQLSCMIYVFLWVRFMWMSNNAHIIDAGNTHYI